MKKRIFRKKKFFIVLCSILLCGCGIKEQSPAVDKNITFMAIGLNDHVLENEGSEEVIRQYEEYTGIHVDWRWVATENYHTALEYSIRDTTTIPMIVTVGNNMWRSISSEAKKGKFWDLKPFLEREDLFPNLSQADERVLKMLEVNGQVIGIYRGRPVGRYGFSYRKDWAEAVGIFEDPKTIDEVYELLYRFTYDDPDGNGIQDTYGLEMCNYTGSFSIIQTWFGCGNEWIEKNGRLIPVHETQEYQDALDWLRKVYEDGLIRPDWALVDASAFGEGIKTGETGAIVDVMGYGKRAWQYFKNNQVKSVVDESSTASMSLVGPIEGATLSTEGYNGFFVITREGAKTEADVINCLTFLDKMCDDEMMNLAEYGLENVEWKYGENGEIVNIWMGKEQERPEYGLNQAICYIPRTAATYGLRKKDEIETAQEEAYRRNEEVAVYNPALRYQADSVVNAEKGTELAQILENARTAYICGQIDKQQLSQRFEEWNERGGLELKEEINEMYRRNFEEDEKNR